MELEIQGCNTFAGEGPHVLLVRRQFIKVSEGILHNSYYCCYDSKDKKSDKLKIFMPHKLTNHYLKVTTMKLLQACYIYWSITWASL